MITKKYDNAKYDQVVVEKIVYVNSKKIGKSFVIRALYIYIYIFLYIRRIMSSSEPRKNVRQCTSIRDLLLYAWARKTTKRHLKHWFIPQLRDILPHLKRPDRVSLRVFTVVGVGVVYRRARSLPAKGSAHTLRPGKNLREKLDANIS